MHNATHYAIFETAAHATAAHTALHSALNNTAHVVLHRNNTVHVSRTFKQHKKAVKFVDKTVVMFWNVCNTVVNNAYDVDGNSDVICDQGYSSY